MTARWAFDTRQGGKKQVMGVQMKTTILAALALAAPAAVLAQAPAPAAGQRVVPESPRGVSGAYIASTETQVGLKVANGETNVALNRGWTVSVQRDTTADAIKPGDFIASTQTDVDANSGKSTELRIFEPGYQPEIGTHAMPNPNTSITHGTVTKSTKTKAGQQLVVTYPGGSRNILVPPGVKVTAYDLRDRSALKPGDWVGAVTRRGPDDVFRAGRLVLSPTPPPPAAAPAPAPGAPAPARLTRRFTISRSVPISLSVEAAKAAVASCKGWGTGVTILDAGGLAKYTYIDDGAAGNHAVNAFRKANTALLLGAPSEDIKSARKAQADVIALSPNDYTTNAGGLPIVVNGEVIGAIGVSGAEPSEKDKACAEDGLKAIQGRLK